MKVKDIEGVLEERRCADNAVATIKDASRRRSLGAYYTPIEVARLLVNWATSSKVGTIFDPSFGGCSFLAAAIENLTLKGVDDAGRLVWGADVDPSCNVYVKQHSSLVPDQCLESDFFLLEPKDLEGAPFDAIVGNPPFLRHHKFKGRSRQAAELVVERAGVDLPATANAWAYFLVHSLSFLRQGGQIAMLVPEAILQADYSVSVRSLLANVFSQVALIHLRSRVFYRTDEPVVALLGTGYGNTGSLSIHSVETVDCLRRLIESDRLFGKPLPRSTLKRNLSQTASESILEEVCRSCNVKRLEELASIKIGVVTGANSHFLISSRAVAREDIPRAALLPIISKTSWLTGSDVSLHDLSVIGEDAKSWLLWPTDEHLNHQFFQRWLAQGASGGIPERYKCRSRREWHKVPLTPFPDAFLTSARLSPPILVLNRGGLLCTNNIHCLYWRLGSKVKPEAVSVAFLSSLVSLWAELHGRRYGRGILKMEPGTLKKAPIPIVSQAAQAFDEVNQLLRRGCEDEARAVADRVVLKQGLGLDDAAIVQVQETCRGMMQRRSPIRYGCP